MDDSFVPSSQDILHYDFRLGATALTIQGSDDDDDLWRQNDKDNVFGSFIADTMYTNGRIRALRYVCNGNGSNSHHESDSTSILRIADATKVCFLTGLRACGNQIRHLTLLSSLSSPTMVSGSTGGVTEYSVYNPEEGPFYYDERPYGRDEKRRRAGDFSGCPLLVSSMDETETAWITETTPQDVNNIMSATLLLSTTMWNCRNLKELVLELSPSSSGSGAGVCNDVTGEDNEAWEQVAFSLQSHPHLEIVRLRIQPSSSSSSSSSSLKHERGRHERQGETIDEQQDAEMMARATHAAPGPLDIFVMQGLVTLPRLRIFELRGHGNAASTAGDSAKLQASSMVALMMQVPSLNVLHYSNLGFATDFDSIITKEFLLKWQNNESSLRELDLSDNSLTDRDVMAIAELVQVQVWPALCKINLLNNPHINYCGNVAISTAVQELKKKKSGKQVSLLLSTFSLYPIDDEEEKDDDDNEDYRDDNHHDHHDGHPAEPSVSPTTTMLPPTSYTFSPLHCGGGGVGDGRQDCETPPLPTFAWNDTPLIASTFTPFSSHENSDNNNMDGTNDMMTE